jgi:DNA-binding GntR family transcriptional regulator
LRTAGEALAVWLTIPQLTKHACDELARDLKAIDKATDLDARVAHRRFHAALRVGAGQRMEQELAQLFEQAERYQLAFWRRSQKSDKSRKRTEHREILRACRLGDRALAVRLLVEHTSRTAYGLVEAEDPGRGLPRLDAAVRMTKRGLR